MASPVFIVLWFAFTIMHGSRRAAYTPDPRLISSCSSWLSWSCECLRFSIAHFYCVAVILNCLCTVTILSRMLYAFVSHCRSSEECTGTHITVTYIVSGFVGGSGNKVCRIFSCHTVTICLQNLTCRWKMVVASVIYCAPYISPVIPVNGLCSICLSSAGAPSACGWWGQFGRCGLTHCCTVECISCCIK